MNYDLEMEKEIASFGKKVPKLLLHACCAPCSSAVLERLSSIFQITILYYNPNITDHDEYQKRLEEIHRFVSVIPVKNPISIIDGRYDPLEFFQIAKGLEQEKERGKRCYQCYLLRLKETANLAKKLQFDYFATTLTLSPYKNSQWINEIGKQLEKDFQVSYLYSDFKKKGGYQRSIELSRKYDLYRQNFCGCLYSRRGEKNGIISK